MFVNRSYFTIIKCYVQKLNFDVKSLRYSGTDVI